MVAKDRTARALKLAVDREIVIERVFDAPRELVFDAWTDPKAVGQWFGPNGSTMTIREMYVRPDGVWSFIFHGPDGTDYDNKIIFTEVARPGRLVYFHGTSQNPREFEVTVTFAAQGKCTKLTMRSLFPTQEARDKTIEFGAIEGGNQTMDRLAQYLAKKQ